MRCSPLALLAALACSTLGLTGCGTTSRFASRAYHLLPFTGKEEPGVTRTRNLSLSMELSPQPVSLAETRQVDVKLRLKNTSHRFVQLQFPTTQRIEILVRNEEGKLVTQWSEDRSFEPVPGYVGINPGEHIEYATSIPTRDLQGGRHYTVTGFFPNFEELRVEKPLVPQG